MYVAIQRAIISIGIKIALDSIWFDRLFSISFDVKDIDIKWECVMRFFIVGIVCCMFAMAMGAESVDNNPASNLASNAENVQTPNDSITKTQAQQSIPKQAQTNKPAKPYSTQTNQNNQPQEQSPTSPKSITQTPTKPSNIINTSPTAPNKDSTTPPKQPSSLKAIQAGSKKSVPNAKVDSKALANSKTWGLNDVFNLGLKPTAPQKQQSIPSFIPDFSQTTQSIKGRDWDFIALSNQAGGIITIWDGTPKGWVWTHGMQYVNNFGDAYNWKIELFNNGHIRFVNKRTKTCLSAYTQGVIHYPCEALNLNQAFLLKPMDNGAFVLFNIGTQRCIEGAIGKKADYPLRLAKCLKNNVANTEQQWLLIPPFLEAKPIVIP